MKDIYLESIQKEVFTESKKSKNSTTGEYAMNLVKRLQKERNRDVGIMNDATEDEMVYTGKKDDTKLTKFISDNIGKNVTVNYVDASDLKGWDSTGYAFKLV